MCLGVKIAQATGIRRSRFSLAIPALGRGVCPSDAVKLSPDDTKLAYVKISLDKVPLPDATCSVWIVNTNGEERKQVPIPLETGDLVQLRWSPDGKRFALGLRDQVVPRRRNVEDRIVVVDVDGSDMRKLPLPPSKLLLNDWLPATVK